MNQEVICYIIIEGTTQLLKAEKVLKQGQEKFWIVPKPRQITSDCGMCVACLLNNKERILDIITEAKIQYAKVECIPKKQSGFLAKLFG